MSRPRMKAKSDALDGRIQAIAEVAAAWRKPRSPWMSRARRAVAARRVYSPSMVEACLRCVFEGYEPGALREWVCRDFPRGAFPKIHADALGSRVLILLPSTVFAAAWQAATAVWLAGLCPVLKPSRREPVFACLLAASVRAIAGRRLPIEAVSPAVRRPAAFRKIIAYGSDRTLAALEAGPKNRRVIAFGSRISAAFLGARAAIPGAARRAAWDAVLYDTQGCLSPQCFFVEDDRGGRRALRFAAALAEEMRQMDRRLPVKPVAEEAFEQESFWQRWQFRASQQRARIFSNRVVFHDEPLFEPGGLRRVVFVTSVSRAADLPRRLGAWAARLSTVAGADAGDMATLARLFRGRPDVRLCEIGRMHQPPPSWRNGGVNLLRELGRGAETGGPTDSFAAGNQRRK